MRSALLKRWVEGSSGGVPGTALLCLCVLLVGSAARAQDAAPAAGAVTILDGSSIWRVLHSWAPPLVQTEGQFKEHKPPAWRACPCTGPGFHFMTRYPSTGWTALEFDDSSWCRRPFFAKYANGESDHRAGGGMADCHLRQLSLRGEFTVTDPSAVKSLSLNLAYRGGAIVYLNGKEVARADLPAGEIAPGAPAEMYPLQAYLREDGKPQAWWPPNKEAEDAYKLRVRRLDRKDIPLALLRRGTNVLAVEIHAAGYPEACAKTAIPWGSAGLIELQLRTDAPEGIAPNVVRPSSLQVWNTNVMAELYDFEYGDPHEPLRPIALAGAKNGCYSGRVAVGSDQPIRDLKAQVSNLSGPGGVRIPASAIRVSFGRFEHARGSRWGGALDYRGIAYGPLDALHDDALADSVPPEVPVAAKKVDEKARAADGLPKFVSGAVQSVYVSVHVPADAAPGDYKGTLTVTVERARPVEVPVELKVIDWALPDPGRFEYFLGMIESPEGVALTYDVEPWSERHWELVGKSLHWVGQLGPKVLLLPLGAESQYGNEQSLVLWVQGADGKYAHDFSRLERYVDLAVKQMGKPRLVVCGVWDSCMHVSVPKDLRREFPRFTTCDPAGKTFQNADGPKNGTPESLEFWRPVLTGVRDVLVKRGLAEAMLVGYVADRQPDAATVKVFHDILPDVGWQGTRHAPTGGDQLAYEGGTVPIRYQGNVWGGWDHHDPDCRRVYGWKYPVKPGLRVWLDRDLFDGSPVPQFRTACEQALLADRAGLGQVGADFWPVKNAEGKPVGTMVGRFPATSEGNLGIYAGQLLYPAPEGPVPTLRYEMMRENIQECEARIFLEKLLTAKPCPLPDDLAGKCQQVLDERTRWHRMRGVAGEASLYWAYSGWEARTVSLYQACADAARALREAAVSATGPSPAPTATPAVGK